MQPNDAITDHFRLNRRQQAALAKLGIRSLKDLLFHFPHRYQDETEIKTVSELQPKEKATLYGRFYAPQSGKTYQRQTPYTRALIEDETGRAEAIWFHQPYISKMIEEGDLVKVSGEVSFRKNKPAFTNPQIEAVRNAPTKRGGSLFGDNTQIGEPVYSEKQGITSNWIFHAVKKILSSGLGDELTDPLPDELRQKYHLPQLKTALHWIHVPQKKADAEAARKRFAFQEVFFIQLQQAKQRAEREAQQVYRIENATYSKEQFVNQLPFSTTAAQDRAIDTTLSDMQSEKPMSRLLEGDVGSGKTVVAAASAYAAVNTPPPKQNFGRLQVAYMAPTEILAKQQFESFIANFKHQPLQIGLITGSGCRKFPSKVDPAASTNISRTQLLKWVENGEIAVLIGTHTLIQKSVRFQNLGLAVIDEQHRFGTIQRQNLITKNEVTPHLLTMTATPIPRTLALTLYGDLDLSVLDELPPGRIPVKTEIITPAQRRQMFDQIRSRIREGRQAYVICPRINEPDPDREQALQVASVKEETRYLDQEIFPELKVEALHGQMKAQTKKQVMDSFAAGEIDILVSTSVIEVGVNVENATVMLIEGAERFGLAQLHQLRGRIQRSSHQPYCFICSDTENEKSIKRLRTLKKAKNGFELAEYDLAQRGAGELSGRRQWGVSDLAMEAIKNIKMVEAAREAAREIIEQDPELKQPQHQPLEQYLDKQYIHFE